jgi:hypothetical protein
LFTGDAGSEAQHDVIGAKNNFQITDPISAYLNDNQTMAISNDVLIEIEFDDSSTVRSATNYVNVYVSNDKTNNQFRTNPTELLVTLESIPNLTECKYIYKKWLSGFKELYIYLPTTYTFYNEYTSEDYGKE